MNTRLALRQGIFPGLIVSLALGCAACGKEIPPDSNDLGGGGQGGADLAMAPQDGSQGMMSADLLNAAGDLIAPMPKPPLLDSIHGEKGAVVVGWTNGDPACEMNEGWRKWALESYKQVFSVSGATTTYTDMTAVMLNTNYTYRVRCLKGGVYSDWSNELSAMPQ